MLSTCSLPAANGCYQILGTCNGILANSCYRLAVYLLPFPDKRVLSTRIYPQTCILVWLLSICSYSLIVQLAGLHSNVFANGRHNVQCMSLLLESGTCNSWPSRTSRSSRSSRTFVTAFTNARAMDNSMVRTNIRLTNRARKRSWSYHFGKRPFVLTSEYQLVCYLVLAKGAMN